MRWLTVVAVLVVGCANSSPKDSCSTADQCTNPNKPYCVSGTCAACDGPSACTPDLPLCAADTNTCATCTADPDCAAYPTMTHCNGTTGACVGCVMSSQCAPAAPVCDATSQMCRGCAADTECTSGVCDLTGGTCVAEASVLYASPTGGASSACTRLDPCTLPKVFSLVDGSKNTIKIGVGTYSAGVSITSDQATTVYGRGATLTGNISLTSGATVKLLGVSFLADGGLYCLPLTTTAPMPTWHLEDVSFDTTGTVQGGPTAIQATSCVLDIHRTKFKMTGTANSAIYASADTVGSALSNRGTQVTVDRSSFEGGEPAIGLYNYSSLHMENSVAFGVTVAYSTVGYDANATGTIDFSTFVNWAWASGNAAKRFVSSNNVFYDPLHNNTNTLTGTVAEHHYDLAYPQAVDPNGSNNMRGMSPMLTDPAAHNFHLLTGSPAIDSADPSATMGVDYDGTARPQGPRRDIGAFEYK